MHIALGLVCMTWAAVASEVDLKKVPELVPAASPTPISVPSQTPTPLVSVDFARLQVEFERATQGEFQALLHRNRIEREELERSLQARTRLWEDQKAQEQRKFFDENRDPLTRREFQRRMELERAAHRTELASERQKRISSHQAAERALQEDQRRRREEFQKYIQRKEVPPLELWPKRGI